MNTYSSNTNKRFTVAATQATGGAAVPVSQQCQGAGVQGADRPQV